MKYGKSYVPINLKPIDSNSQDYKLDCVADWLLETKTRTEILKFLNVFCFKKPGLEKDMRMRLNRQLEIIRQNRRKAKL